MNLHWIRRIRITRKSTKLRLAALLGHLILALFLLFCDFHHEPSSPESETTWGTGRFVGAAAIFLYLSICLTLYSAARDVNVFEVHGDDKVEDELKSGVSALVIVEFLLPSLSIFFPAIGIVSILSSWRRAKKGGEMDVWRTGTGAEITLIVLYAIDMILLSFFFCDHKGMWGKSKLQMNSKRIIEDKEEDDGMNFWGEEEEKNEIWAEAETELRGEEMEAVAAMAGGDAKKND